MENSENTPPKLNAQQRLHYRFFIDQMTRLEYDLRSAVYYQDIVPPDWHSILDGEPVKGTTRVTIRLDEDLVRFFRKLGPRWQTKLNKVVRAYVKARMAGIVRDMEEAMEPSGKRPHVGSMEDFIEGKQIW